MTEAVPDDVMKRARELRGRLFWNRLDEVEIIADALMEERAEERERCAKIADAHAANTFLKPGAQFAAISIAATIRDQSRAARDDLAIANWGGFEVTPELRWRDGVLEQCWKASGYIDGVVAAWRLEWRPVPTEPTS